MDLKDFEQLINFDEEKEIPLLNKQHKQQIDMMNEAMKKKFNNNPANFNIDFIKELYFKANQNGEIVELSLKPTNRGFAITKEYAMFFTFVFFSDGEDSEERIKIHVPEKGQSFDLMLGRASSILKFFVFDNPDKKPKDHDIPGILALFDIAIDGWPNKISLKTFFDKLAGRWNYVYDELIDDPFKELQEASSEIQIKPKTIAKKKLLPPPPKPKAKPKAKAKAKTKAGLVKTIVKSAPGKAEVTYEKALESVPIEEMLKAIQRSSKGSHIVEDISDSDSDSKKSHNKGNNNKGNNKCPFYKHCGNFVDVKSRSISLPSPHDNVRICKDCWASPRSEYELFDFRCILKNNKSKCRNCNESLKTNQMVIRDGEKKCKNCLYKFLNKKHIL